MTMTTAMTMTMTTNTRILMRSTSRQSSTQMAETLLVAGEADDGSVFPILERYAGMINGFAPPPQHPGRADFFPLDGNERPLRNTHIHSTILRRGNTSVTIVSGPAHEFMGGGLRSGGRRLDPFATILSGVMRDMGLTNGESRSPDEPEGQGGPATNPLARGLAEILGLLNPANAVAGDAVYSQEALDRIITNLMEAHPQSNAAPPASEEALADLDRRFVDSKMLEGESNTECAICIDNMKVGDMAAFLPCKHWFHEECVVLWLKEHNTCPVCRASIERREANGNGNGNGGRNDRTNPTAPQNPSFLRRATSTVSGGIPILNHRSNSTQQAPRPPSQSQSRLNEVLRNMTSRASEQERDPARESARDSARESARDWDARERDRDRDWTQPFSYGSYDTSRLQRRTSLSPTSPRQAAPGDYRRMRQRSPSQSSGRRENRNTEQGGRPSMSAFNWFREQFANRGNSSRDNNRE
ncbi:putative RING finger protein [Escovopsis weberi]|uniref:RING-type E3 ubiquitin transferase n=1 Tax=Escovopsis weberi TaxID=150374 RepID=A0A0M8MXS2_ESCWE|nr:putative RING finger protein [Escovopsis weberi]